MYSKFHQLLIVLLICFSARGLFAQSAVSGVAEDGVDANSASQAADIDVNQVEDELKRVSQPKVSRGGSDAAKEDKIETFSDLGKLAPFSEVSIIQKRYLPKTGRFQAFAGLTYTTNDPWFWGLGFSGKFGYFLTEAWGLEASYTGISSSEKDSVKNLRNNNGVTTNSMVTPKSFLGLDLVWTPVYGKMSVGNKKIMPFDMYFSLGGGNTTTADSQSAGTMRVATGQIFALSKGMGFRWDFCWNRYNAKGIDNSSSSFDNLLLTLGVSFFFPEAKYR